MTCALGRSDGSRCTVTGQGNELGKSVPSRGNRRNRGLGAYGQQREVSMVGVWGWCAE